MEFLLCSRRNLDIDQDLRHFPTFAGPYGAPVFRRILSRRRRIGPAGGSGLVRRPDLVSATIFVDMSGWIASAQIASARTTSAGISGPEEGGRNFLFPSVPPPLYGSNISYGFVEDLIPHFVQTKAKKTVSGKKRFFIGFNVFIGLVVDLLIFVYF